MSQPTLSIVIPTHRRARILTKCLSHVQAQTARAEVEVIVVSDGDDPKTTSLLSGDRWAIPVTSFSIPKSQQGVARNRGVERSNAPYTLFIGDDVLLQPNACEKHISAHERQRSSDFDPQTRGDGASGASVLTRLAVLGFTTWDPDVGVTSTMRWLEASGWQFGYAALARHAHAFVPSHVQHYFTYASHISLPTEVARCHPFREDVTLYGWEDVEWGIRLRRDGVRLFYEPDARALHHHRMTRADSLRRMETIGASALQVDGIDPELGVLPRGWKRIAYELLARTPTERGLHCRAFLRGLKTQADRPQQPSAPARW